MLPTPPPAPNPAPSPAIVCAARPHGETAAIVRLLTAEHGLIAAYVAGGRGRVLRPVLVPGNLVEPELTLRPGGALPFARIELVASRAGLITEPLPAAAIAWVTALAAAALPERQPFPALHAALSGVLAAIAAAPSARGWGPGLIAYERLVLRELGYGDPPLAEGDDLARFDALGVRLSRYLLADRRGDAMGARALLRERLAKIG